MSEEGSHYFEAMQETMSRIEDARAAGYARKDVQIDDYSEMCFVARHIGLFGSTWEKLALRLGFIQGIALAHGWLTLEQIAWLNNKYRLL